MKELLELLNMGWYVRESGVTVKGDSVVVLGKGQECVETLAIITDRDGITTIIK